MALNRDMRVAATVPSGGIDLRSLRLTNHWAECIRLFGRLLQVGHHSGAMDKRHILDEIKRTAQSNGGVPLGRQRFFSETGIKESDWLGKFWVRWSDAIREAGFLPNQMQSGFSDEHLLEKYATLVREIGRVPTAADVKLKSRSDPEFPSHNTFSRFGSKTELLAMLIAHCRARKSHADVVTLCEPSLPSIEPAERVGRRESLEDLGFVYLIKAGRFYKIGKTNAVGRRERELAIQLPEKSVTVHSIRTDDPAGIEAYWHKRFEAKRKHGEWFDLSASDIAAFRRRKFM